MADLNDLRKQHLVFAEETFAFLLNNSKAANNDSSSHKYFQPYIGDAIETLSYMFRKDYRKVFRRLRESLKHAKMFESYCMTVPVQKDERYFYYILMRASLIFELSVYCYNKGYDYIRIGQKCLAEYEDLEYFESIGGWSKLEHAALFIASLGHPLLMIFNHKCNYHGIRPQTFSEAYDALYHNYIIAGDLKMIDSAEIYCLSTLKHLFSNEIDCAQTEETEKETQFFKHPETSAKSSSFDTKALECIIITEYFKKCWHDIISSVTLDHSVKNLQEEYLSKLTTPNVKSRELQNSASNLKVDFSGKNVAYIIKFKSSCSSALMDISIKYLDIEECSSPTTDSMSCASDVLLSSSGEHCSENSACVPERKPLSPNRTVASLKPTGFVPSFYPTFIVPNKYLRLKETGSTSNCTYLYSLKMCPPSRRMKLSEHMKKLLDENIENQNYDTIPSGDLLVCPRASSQNDYFIILVDSSTDDEVVEYIDTLLCLFKKLEIDSIGNEQGYSLRPRQHSLLEKERSKRDLDMIETTSGEMTSDEESLSNSFRTVKRKYSRSTENEDLYGKVIISLYKRNITLFLDEYFRTNFSPISTRPQKKPKIDKDCVFAVTASIMAKRKVLLNEYDEMKRLVGIQLYDIHFRPQILPLDIQRALDYHIRKRQYFASPNGAYGVGRKCANENKNIWIIFFSGDGNSNAVKYNHEDLKILPEIFLSYEPVLEAFISSPKNEFETLMASFRSSLNDLVTDGFNVKT